ncbi:MAG TPA: hypothetical protein H9991_12300 [Candidatus Mailhella excrementigallinarum]|nr:hypothetical protein [Candidatus Mailhella excrementigallinarum]
MPTHRMTTPIFSAEYWELKNPILLRGERGLAEFYDEDGHVTRIREKVGDGVMGEDRVITGTHWNDLPWIITGEKGDKGDAGPMPKHDWSGTALRFQNPDGTWGDRVDLKGDPGNRVNAEPATTTTLGGVMPATGLRVDIEGYEYVALGWDKEKCYPDPIVVAYNGSPWLWLQESGVGTEAGVRMPGLETSAQYWRQIANIVDIPKPGIGLELDAEANAYDVKYGNESGTALEGNGVALSAKKLQTPRTITVELGQQTGEEFDGTANITPGVSGILNPANGGTGVNSLQALAQALQQSGLIGGDGIALAAEGSYSISSGGLHYRSVGGLLIPVVGTLKRVVFSTHASVGTVWVNAVLVDGVKVATTSNRPLDGSIELSAPVQLRSSIYLELGTQYSGGGSDAYKEGSWSFSVLIK